MGEAKRKKQASGGTTQFYDPIKGEVRTARNAGGFADYFSSMQRFINGKGPQPGVPCNGCTECCFHHKVEVDPREEHPEDFAHLLTEPDPEDGLRLRHRPDGACIHLGENGCTIYDHRPRACRQYDYRTFSMFSFVDTYNNGHQSLVWMFETSSEEERLFKEAHSIAAMIAFSKHKDDTDGVQVALKEAEKMVPSFYQGLLALKQLPLEEITKLTRYGVRGKERRRTYDP